MEGVVAEIQKTYFLIHFSGEMFKSDFGHPEVDGLDYELVIGDKILFEKKNNQFLLQKILPRKNKLSRKKFDRTTRFKKGRESVIAANIDTAVITASAKNPKFSPRFIDRYLIICQKENITPLICINKIDLVKNPPDLSIYENLGIEIVFTSAENNIGVEDLKNRLKDKISVFTGHSGVGKSSLINKIVRNDSLETGNVRERDGRGRHTTVSSKLVEFDKYSFIIDTPGIRSLSFWEIEKEDLRHYFPEFEECSDNCRFRNCSHTHEPNCEVKRAVEENEISKERYESYVRLYLEE